MTLSFKSRLIASSLIGAFSLASNAYAGVTQSAKQEAVKINGNSVYWTSAYTTVSAKSVKLFNTGVDGNGNVSNGNAADPNFKVNINGDYAGQSKNLTFTPSYVATKANGDVHPYWLDDNTTSAWVTPYQDGLKTLDPTSNGKYIYTESFTLSGLESFEKLSLSGRWAADNYGVMKLNGTVVSTISVSGSNDHSSFHDWHAFNISLAQSNLFVNGTNTFTWEITNIAQSYGNPSGLRVEFDNFAVVPENDAYAMIIAGLGLVGFIVKRRNA